MARIAGVNIPLNKRVEIGLTYVYGIGRSTSNQLLTQVGVEPDRIQITLDLTPGTTMDNVGGSAYWATTAELQSAIPGVPNEYGLRATAFVDAGSVFRYSGSTASLQVANKHVMRSSVGAGLTWASPFGALTVDYAVPLSKAAYDVVQPLRFSAGGF